jgi:hypothetical protein
MSATPRPFTILPPGTSVAGPSSGGSTDNALVRWDGTGGRTTQNSVWTLDDTGTLTGAGSQTLAMLSTGALALTASGTNQNITLTPSGTGYVDAATGKLRTTGYLGAGNAGVVWFGNTTSNYIYYNASDFEFASTGSFIFGTAVNSNNGKIQIATHTTSAGGIGFGTATSLFTQSAGHPSFDHATDISLELSLAGTKKAYWEALGTNVFFGAVSGGSVVVQSGGTTALTLDSSQIATFASNVVWGAGNAAVWTGRAAIQSPASGVIQISNSAGTDFSRLQFGGTTSSFPALKRSTTSLEVKLADDSTYTNLTALTLTTSAAATAWTLGAANAVSPTSPNRTITVSVGGTTYYLHAKTTND